MCVSVCSCSLKLEDELTIIVKEKIENNKSANDKNHCGSCGGVCDYKPKYHLQYTLSPIQIVVDLRHTDKCQAIKISWKKNIFGSRFCLWFFSFQMKHYIVRLFKKKKTDHFFVYFRWRLNLINAIIIFHHERVYKS